MRPGSQEDHSTIKGNCKTNLTLTGLLMEGLMFWRCNLDPHRPYQPSRFLLRTCETREAAKGNNMGWVVSAFGFKKSRHGWQSDHGH